VASWTRKEIIREILRREAAGLSLALGRSREGSDSRLYQAGSRIFGSWSNAIDAAGISRNRVKSRDWSPAKIIAQIRSLARRRQPPVPGELKQQHAELIAAARRCFSSWQKAVIAAGVDPSKLRRVMPWTHDRIIEAILTRALRGEPLNSSSVKPKSLTEAGARAFGSWQAALIAAGIRARRTEAGPPRQRDPRHATRRSPTAGMTVEADATCSPPRSRRPHSPWSESEILQAIRTRFRANKPMNAAGVDVDDGPLYRAARRRFGAWKSALTAAGVEIVSGNCGAETE
jgi:hypothetical protein